jgi:glycosyltransferase involved in cell wall biosynthesis
VACYNEEENIVATLDTLTAALTEVGSAYEVIVIDDASTDQSVGVVRRYMHEHPQLPLTLKVNEKNRGLAYNFVEGAFMGSGRYYRFICGDNVEPKETFVTIFKQLGKADMIIPYQDCAGRPLLRRALSRAYTGLVNLISGHRIRYYNGNALHLRYNVMRWHPNCHGFGFQADLITRLLDQGASYQEVRVKAQERKKGRSKALTLKNFLSVTHTLLDLSIRRIGQARLFLRRSG